MRKKLQRKLGLALAWILTVLPRVLEGTKPRKIRKVPTDREEITRDLAAQEVQGRRIPLVLPETLSPVSRRLRKKAQQGSSQPLRQNRKRWDLGYKTDADQAP